MPPAPQHLVADLKSSIPHGSLAVMYAGGPPAGPQLAGPCAPHSASDSSPAQTPLCAITNRRLFAAPRCHFFRPPVAPAPRGGLRLPRGLCSIGDACSPFSVTGHAPPNPLPPLLHRVVVSPPQPHHTQAPPEQPVTQPNFAYLRTAQASYSTSAFWSLPWTSTSTLQVPPAS